MKYPVAIHKDNDSDYGITVPDIPGCFSAGGTLDEALKNAVEAITGHLEILAEDGEVAPQANIIDVHFEHPDFQEASWAYVDIDISAFLGKTEKATVTLPKLLINKIDMVVASGNAKSRSAFLAESAMQALTSRE